jgi:hypothetical protein
VSTASSTCREGFELRSWMSSEEREDEEGEVRRGSEAEGSRFNVGVMAIVRGNSFYMNIFGLCWYRVSCVVTDIYICIYILYIYIYREGPAGKESLQVANVKPKERHLWPLSKKEPFKHQLHPNTMQRIKDEMPPLLHFCCKRMALKSHMQDAAEHFVPQGVSKLA